MLNYKTKRQHHTLLSESARSFYAFHNDGDSKITSRPLIPPPNSPHLAQSSQQASCFVQYTEAQWSIGHTDGSQVQTLVTKLVNYTSAQGADGELSCFGDEWMAARNGGRGQSGRCEGGQNRRRGSFFLDESCATAGLFTLSHHCPF